MYLYLCEHCLSVRVTFTLPTPKALSIFPSVSDLIPLPPIAQQSAPFAMPAASRSFCSHARPCSGKLIFLSIDFHF